MGWEGWNIGSVTIRRVCIEAEGEPQVQSRRHGGDVSGAIRAMLAETDGAHPTGAVVTGPLAESVFTLPYLPEPVCVEQALRALHRTPDMVLALGGESFVVYCVSEGHIRNMVSSSRCAAGSGEFILQQFGRMGLELREGIEIARQGRHLTLASRCSVHIKSDATHKLNKGECAPRDIAHTLVVDLAAKIAALIESAAWAQAQILVAGGGALNGLLVESLRSHFPDSQIDVLPESPYLEAYGAAIAARGRDPLTQPLEACLRTNGGAGFATLPPLSDFVGKVTRLAPPVAALDGNLKVLLGVDAGSTTTKAVLVDKGSGALVASCYLRTHGNPVQATAQCLAEISQQIAGRTLEVVQVAVTGSGRELVSVSLGGCLSFNEILAHARAAREAQPNVDTILEIGGQDAKFVSLQAGTAVDYAMNDGCSAGTGSFLEETAASDMQSATEAIGPLALEAPAPLAFGERCAAFINTEIRTALQSGADPRNIVAGLVYSIVKNYLSRVVGTRSIGSVVLLQGGVALNSAVAPALASVTGREVVVPPHPELMGCLGAALMARDLLAEGAVAEQPQSLARLGRLQLSPQGAFTCQACQNHCEIQRLRLNGGTYPFGGLCSRWEMQRRPERMRHQEGQDLVGLRDKMMFEDFAPPQPVASRGRVGLPLALTTYGLYPFYARLLTGLGYTVMLSRPGQGRRNTHAPFCYPAELLHAAVDDLLAQGVDWVFLPQVREFGIPAGHAHAYTCSFTEDSAAVIKAFFAGQADRILTPEIGFSPALRTLTRQSLCRLANHLGLSDREALEALRAAMEHQRAFEQAYRQAGQTALKDLTGPLVILVGRPYAAFARNVNLSVPRKIASRGFHVIPADMLPLAPRANRHNVWHFTQESLSAIHCAHQRPETYLCWLSCFSCNPDAIIYHRARHELEGEPFCFLEIDSHTADAGTDTRIGAFLDIIEARRRTAPTGRIWGRDLPGRVDYSARQPRIVTADGRTLSFADPSVTHVLLADTSQITSRLFQALYRRMGWQAIITPFTDAQTLQAARRVCSGRECLPFLAMVGKMVLHLEKRPAGEVTVFHMLEQEGPCQIGNWFDAVRLIFERLDAENAFPVWPNSANNYLGGGETVAVMAATAGVVGDLFGEVRSALRCLAVDRAAALAELDQLEDRLFQAAGRGLVSLELEMRRISRKLAHIPLKGRVAEAPKVLLFSGINRIFVDKPVREFFEQRGILAKTGDVGEFFCFYETEPVVRRGFALGCTTPVAQFAPGTLLRGLLRNPTSQPRFQAVRAAAHILSIELLDHRWRGVMAASGLVFGPDIHYRQLMEAGQQLVSCNGWTEAPCTAGRYALSLAEGAFDGYINIGAFNCTPASTATAVTHDLAMHSRLPYAVIESDGAAITSSQLRQLEVVAAQCWEHKGLGAV